MNCLHLLKKLKKNHNNRSVGEKFVSIECIIEQCSMKNMQEDGSAFSEKSMTLQT